MTTTLRAVVLAFAITTAAVGQTRPAGEKYAFWPAPPEEPRVQFLRSFDGEAKGGANEVGGKRLTVAKPYGVAMRGGRIFVCDVRGGGVVLVIDVPKGRMRAIRGEGDLALKDPADVVVAEEDGTAYVVDQGSKTIAVVSPVRGSWRTTLLEW